MSWSVGFHDSVGRVGTDRSQSLRSLHIPVAHYAIDHDQMTAKNLQEMHSAAHNNGALDKFNATERVSNVQRRTVNPNGEVDYANRVMTVHTPEGNPVNESDIDSLVRGHLSADQVRHRTNEMAEMSKQSDFERKIAGHMVNNGGLPHSGTDALVAGVPTADSELGRHISAGFEGGSQKSGYRFPHYSGDMTRANPKYPTPPNRASDSSRVVDHR